MINFALKYDKTCPFGRYLRVSKVKYDKTRKNKLFVPIPFLYCFDS